MDPELHPKTEPGKRVVVIGGGLAGLSAACSLIAKGHRVTLIEKRPFLGGRAFSFVDREAGVEVDNGQHIFMGCCTYFIDFLRQIGAHQKVYIQGRLKVKVVRGDKEGFIYSVPWLGPLHLLPSLIRYPHIGLKDKALAIYALLKMKLMDRERSKAHLDKETFHSWLKRRHQSERSINALWNLVVLPTLNDDVKDVSAYMGIMVFQEGLLKTHKEATIGYARVGLTSLSGDSAQEYITSRGGELILGKAVTSMRMDGDRMSEVTLIGGESVQGDVFVSALPFHTLPDLLPPVATALPDFLTGRELTASPIVGIHMWYDRHVMDGDFIAFLDSPVQWVFNKTSIQGLDPSAGQYLCISLSGAWQFTEMSKEGLKDLFTEEMKRLFPRAAEASIQRFLTVKQLQATFRPTPGSYHLRPGPRTPIDNLFLAGEWTDTGWPSTMESAVRSGVFAAQAVESGN